MHEIGHAHGRLHAPCGSPDLVDPDYPHKDATLGSWGYDLVGDTWFAPDDNVDMMSYCKPIWVSDYTFRHLYLRMQEVAGQARAMPAARSIVRVGSGEQIVRPREMPAPVGAPRVSVDLFDANGQRVSVTTAAWFPYDHLPGGIAVLDEVLPEGWRAWCSACDAGRPSPYQP